MKLRTPTMGMAATALVLACSAPARNGPRTTEARNDDKACFYGCKPEGKPATPAPPAKHGAVAERARLLREAADQLDRAQAALDRGNKDLAEWLFSTAELLVGPSVVASIAQQFRAGGPPRVTTPPRKIDASARPQPKVVGSSEAEDETARVPPPRVEGSLTGTLQIDGRAPSGAFGLITLEPARGTWKPRTPKRVVLEQRDREFLPHLMAISVGSTVVFPNFDAVFHNVFSTSPPGAFDLGLYKAGEAREYTFKKKGHRVIEWVRNDAGRHRRVG